MKLINSAKTEMKQKVKNLGDKAERFQGDIHNIGICSVQEHTLQFDILIHSFFSKWYLREWSIF